MNKQTLIVLIPASLITLNAIELPPMVVESSKFEDTVIESSSTINRIDQNKLEISDSKSIKELSSLIPNTNISGIGNRMDKTITMRGISNYVTFESSVAMYIDDTPVPFSYGFGMVDMKNIESIEVLKGAQGTLFGKGAESGVINIYTKAPTDEFKSEASLGYGSYNTKEFYGVVSAPTTNEDLTYSVSITKDNSDGFSTNERTQSNFDKKDFLSFSTKLRYHPNTPLDVSLNYTKSKSDDGGSAFKINTKENPYSITNELTNDYVKMNADLLSLVVKYKESDQTFTSSTTHAKESILKNDYVAILGGLDLNFDVQVEEITQEFRFKKSFQSSDLLVGAFYSDKLTFDYKENQKLLALNLNSFNNLSNPDKNMALFTQYKYYIDNHYSLMGGLRYQKTQRGFDRDLNNFGALTTHADSKTEWTHVLPTVSLSYLGDDNSNTYLTYSKGYRPGGYNYRTSNSLVPFEPEKTDSFELGHKKIFNSSFSLNNAIFYNIINDHRINVFDNTLSTTTYNADKAHTYGIESDVTYKNDALLTYVTFGVTKAKIEDFSSNSTYEDKKLIDVPDMTASFGAKYSIDKNYYLKSDIRYMGERYYSIDNSAKESSYTVADVASGYANKNYTFELYADNLFDKRYVDFMINTPSNKYYHFGDPRVFGFRISGKF